MLLCYSFVTELCCNTRSLNLEPFFPDTLNKKTFWQAALNQKPLLTMAAMLDSLLPCKLDTQFLGGNNESAMDYNEHPGHTGDLLEVRSMFIA